MKVYPYYLPALIGTLFISPPAFASFSDYFKFEDGETNWQYVANFSGSVLILLLSLTAVLLLFNYLKLRKANRELEDIRNALEQRVEKRTANLNESNLLLQNSKDALEDEVKQHRETMARLEVSEAYIKSILDSMPLMLIGLDEKMRITQWNKWAENISGIDSEKVIGDYLWDAYPTITLLPDQVKDIIKEQKTITIKQSQRDMFYFDITLYALKTTNGTGIVILLDDVTQQTKNENMLIQRDKMSAIGELASTMAHDIALPLQSISCGIEHLKKYATTENGLQASDQGYSEILTEAEINGRQASAILDNLLHFSRSLGDEKKSLDVTQVVNHALELAGSLFSDSSGLKFKEIRINKKYEDKLPLIPGYTAGLQQVFLSLFRHACHALGSVLKEDIKPEISIDLSQFYDSLWIKVQHNGKGLSSDEQQTIFEPFFQSELVQNEEIENRLSFSYFIITEDHGGHMSVTSDVDVGTTFHIQLQLR